MTRIYVACIAAMYTLVVCLVVPDRVAAQPSTNLKIMIFPLECSVDLTNVGVGVYRNLTPENCLDPIEAPVVPVPIPAPEMEQSPSEPVANPVSAQMQYPSFYSSLDKIFLPTDMSDRVLPAVPLTANADDTRIIKSLPDASSLTWLLFVIISAPVLLLLFRVWQLVNVLIRKR